MRTKPRWPTIVRALLYSLVLGVLIYHIAEAFSRNPLTLRIKSISMENDGTHLMHYEIRNESWIPIELDGGSTVLCLPGYQRYKYSDAQTGVRMVRLTSLALGEYALLKPGERIAGTALMPLRLRPGQRVPDWCDGLQFEYAWMPRIVRRLGIMLRPPLRLIQDEHAMSFECFYVDRVVQIPVELPSPVQRTQAGLE